VVSFINPLQAFLDVDMKNIQVLDLYLFDLDLTLTHFRSSLMFISRTFRYTNSILSRPEPSCPGAGQGMEGKPTSGYQGKLSVGENPKGDQMSFKVVYKNLCGFK